VRRLLALTLALIAAALIAWGELRLPEAAPLDAPAPRFSAARALATDRLIAPVPHPIGSPADRAVRDRLLARMAALGLSPRISRADAVEREPDGVLEGGSAETLVGVLPGRDPTLPALALMAHYDSVPGAPGAADDGAGVSGALETVRAIRARGVPARDVAVILTDGEEAGLLGARGFFREDPLARRLGFVLNLEARGSGGRALMFQTGRDDAGAVALFRRTAVRPLAGSLFGAVYARLPNDTDFSIARTAGLPGFNYAFTGGAFDYHSPTDSLANLDARAVQDLGDQALAAAAAVAGSPALPPRGPDAVYGALLGRASFAYPTAWGWLILALSAGLIALAAARARRLEPLAWSDAARGAGAALYAAAAGLSLLRLAGLVAGSGERGARRLLALPHRWEAALLLLALGVLLVAAAEVARGRRSRAAALALAAAAGSCLAARGLDAIGLTSGLVAALLALAIGDRPAARPGAWAGVLLLGLVLSIAAQALAPLTAYALAWPLALAAIAAAATSLAAERSPGRIAALAAVAAVGLGWAGVYAHLVAVVVGRPEMLVLPLLMAAPVIWPLAQPAPGAPPARIPGRLLLLAGAALVADVRLAGPWNARHPRQAFVAYQLDQDAGRAWRVAIPALRTRWSDAALEAEGGRIGVLRHWAWSQPVYAAPARLAPIAAPTLSLSHAPGGLVLLKAEAPRGARTLTLKLSPDTPARLIRAAGAPLDAALAPGRWTTIRWRGTDPVAVTLAIRPGGPGALAIRYAAGFDQWPAGVAPPRPPPPGVLPTGLSGEALVTGSRRLAW
jgi:hypothetical protein